jgi:integrase
MPKLTKRLVESVKPPAAGQVLIFDDKLAGFGLRVMPSGVRSYFVQYRNAQTRSRRLTIGKHGAITADRARGKAWRILSEVKDGKDPLADRRAFRKAPTVNDLLDRYIAEHVDNDKRKHPHRASTRVEIKRVVERHIRPALGRQKVAAVTREDMEKLHRELADTPRQANFVLAVCSKAFNLAEIWKMRPEHTNPCRHIERNEENHRKYDLSAAELERLGATLRMAEREGLPWRVDERKPTTKHLPKPENRRTLYPRATTAAIELLLFTGCRLSEVLNLRWDQVKFGEGTITLPETKTGKKTEEPQVVVMNAPARQLLKQLEKATASPWVLPSGMDASRPLPKSVIENAWQRIRAAAKLKNPQYGWARLHDLRHTVGTYAGQQFQANAFAIRDLLRHKDLATSGRYVHRVDNPLRRLSERVGGRIAASLAGRKRGEVVPLKRGA